VKGDAGSVRRQLRPELRDVVERDARLARAVWVHQVELAQGADQFARGAGFRRANGMLRTGEQQREIAWSLLR